MKPIILYKGPRTVIGFLLSSLELGVRWCSLQLDKNHKSHVITISVPFFYLNIFIHRTTKPTP